MKDLELHVKCMHITSGQSEGQVAVKPDRLPRPTIGEGVTESDWCHFLDKWSRFKRSTLQGANSQQISDQLWACCESSLEKAVYNSGVTSDNDEKTLLSAINKLAVRAQNTLVNVVKFLDMAQDQDEAVGAYMARLKGQAAVCNF